MSPVPERVLWRAASLICRAALALALLVVAACDRVAPGGSDVAGAPPPLLETIEVVRQELSEPILGTGTLVADKTTRVGPRVDGLIDAVFVEVGDRVTAGEPLFRTRQVDYRIRLEHASAELQLARAEARQAERDLVRVRALEKRGVVSVEQLEAAQTRKEIVLARVEAARTAVKRASQDLQDTVVTAPYDGVITRRDVDEGAMLRTMAAAGSPVVEIMKTDVLVAIVRVPEVHLPRLVMGTPGRIHIEGIDRVIESRVDILNDLVDPATHTVEIRLRIANPDLAVKPGLFVKAEIEPAARSLDVLERRAVLGFGEERYVFVEREGRAIRTSVSVRDLDALRVEVLSGPAPGERILAGPELSRLTDGASVRLSAPARETSRVAL